MRLAFIAYVVLIAVGLAFYIAIGITTQVIPARELALSLFFGVLLLASVAGQSVAGQHQYNADRRGDA